MNIGPQLNEAGDVVTLVVNLDAFDASVKIVQTMHPIVITGIGKSFLIGQRAAATMRSFGIEAWAESATDLLHGGMGCGPGVLIALSHSGETDEVNEVAARLPVAIAVTQTRESTLARASSITLAYGPVSEPMVACGLPITVNYVQAGILDALTLNVAARRGCTPDTVAAWHPGGALGRKMNG